MYANTLGEVGSTSGRSAFRFAQDDRAKMSTGPILSRDDMLKIARARANEWRKNRGYDCLPDLDQVKYPDHLSPMILLSLNTGLRRRELFNLIWDNINLDQAILIVQGDIAKSGRTRHVSLNTVAIENFR